MIITIDGPAGTGKSTVAQAVAQKLNLEGDDKVLAMLQWLGLFDDKPVKEKRDTSGQILLDLLLENKQVTDTMTRGELQALCDPSNYLGQAGVMVDRVLASIHGRHAS